MPWYRVNGMVVHIRGSKLPKPCGATIELYGRPALCLAFSDFECDFPVAPGRTCDRGMCAAHALEAGPNKHLCPEHKDAANQPGLFTQLLLPQGKLL